jgi:hypothetical protein
VLLFRDKAYLHPAPRRSHFGSIFLIYLLTTLLLYFLFLTRLHLILMTVT